MSNTITLPEPTITNDNIIVYGAGKHKEANLVLDKTNAAFLLIKLTEFLNQQDNK